SNDAVATFSMTLNESIEPVPQRAVRCHATLEHDVGPGDAPRKFEDRSVIAALVPIIDLDTGFQALAFRKPADRDIEEAGDKRGADGGKYAAGVEQAHDEVVV